MFTSDVIDENIDEKHCNNFSFEGRVLSSFCGRARLIQYFHLIDSIYLTDGIYSRLVQNIQNWFNIFSCWKRKMENMFLLCLETCVWACVDNSWWTKLVVIINTNCCLITWQYNIFVGLCLFSILRLRCQLARQISSAFFSLC